MEKGLSYREAGVDIDAGNQAVTLIKKHIASTQRPEVLGEVGGFAGLFEFTAQKFRAPVLVAAADGVGTKLKIAFLLEKHTTVGIDLVAMNVNDLLAVGATPLFFLDYIATGKIEPEKIAQIVEGIAAGCREANCALLGGETAEMPGFYQEGEYDLAGFAVGVVEKEKVCGASRVRPGDKIIGLPSTGLHSNGFALARCALLAKAGYKVGDFIPALGKTLGEEMLTPTRIYVPLVLPLFQEFDLHGAAHITGGGMRENISRVLPPGTKVKIYKGSWPVPPIFKLIQVEGKVAEEEMYRVFNLGIGFVLITSLVEAESILKELEKKGEKAYLIGEVTLGDGFEVI